MNDEIKKWFRDHGVLLNEDGRPVPQSTPGPPRPCTRCKTQAECPTPGAARLHGHDVELILCADCFELQLTHNEAFWRGFDAYRHPEDPDHAR